MSLISIVAALQAAETPDIRAGARTDSAIAAAAVATGGDGLLASVEPDWPQWRGPRRDGISAETGLMSSWPEAGPPLLWKVDGIGEGWSSPIVVEGHLYLTGDVGDELVIWCYDRDGKRRWRATNGRAWTGSYPGARAACVYSAGRLYHLNAHGRIVCLEASSGRELWSRNVLEDFGAKNITWGLSECLLVDAPRVIVTPGGTKARMAALDQLDGHTLWTTEGVSDEATSYSSPILYQWAGRRCIANCTSAHGFAADADTGDLLWTVPLRNQYGVNTSTPIFGQSRIFFVTPYGERGRCYELLTDGGGATPRLAWESSLDTVTGAGVLVQGVLYAAGYRDAKWWSGIDWQSGQTRCEVKDFTTGAAIWADGHLYCLDEQGNVGLLRTGGDRLQVAGRFRLVPERVRDAWAHPVIQDGRLYLRYHDTLYCYRVSAR